MHMAVSSSSLSCTWSSHQFFTSNKNVPMLGFRGAWRALKFLSTATLALTISSLQLMSGLKFKDRVMGLAAVGGLCSDVR